MRLLLTICISRQKNGPAIFLTKSLFPAKIIIPAFFWQRGIEQLARGHGGGPPVRLAAQRLGPRGRAQMDPRPAERVGVPAAGPHARRAHRHLAHRRRHPQN
jgi:hypothetical protein